MLNKWPLTGLDVSGGKGFDGGSGLDGGSSVFSWIKVNRYNVAILDKLYFEIWLTVY